ncbi:transposon Tf2-11 polyprotein [Trichonephila clavipes]|nr:transposon Tf2-11 polyprotein [Trichonephila clavipes]
MAYLAKGRRQDLLELAETLDISIPDNFKFLDIKDAILKSEGYDVDFTTECLNRIICDRKELELRAERDRENQRIFELQKLQFTIDISTTADSNMPNNSRRNPISKDRIPEKKIVDTKEDRSPVSCYGCGAPGIIRSRFHTCNPVRQKDDALSSSLNQSNFYSFSSEINPISIIQISICNTDAAVCADTGATLSVAGEKLYHLLKQKGLNFEEKTMQMTLADGRTQTTEILTTSVDISIQGKVIPTELLILKNARGNRTLLGIDFLTAAGIVLDLQRKQWYFTETSHRKYNFVKAPPNINALLTVDPDPHLCQLWKNEGTHLSLPQREEINSLLEKNHLPVAVPPYRTNPSKKEILKQEIDRLLSEGIIEECESPYASPVVLIPKPNGTFRLCIDYRKLNEITVADTYPLPLPRMDDLLHQAKLTPFMSTLDLRAGYHQVKVHVEDQDKTAFVCPFGTYRFYECHMRKCHFASSRVKYLGFWITQKGIEVDPEKVASILDIPPPKNVKELQSFLQTCSWFRRYIQDFAKISRPLSYLTKKKVKWQWGFDQQNAFQTLKNSLTTPPVLKQADGTKPYIIRTDASNYALGAVLLQGEGSDEHPIEYASRLLTPAERNYSTTEREALAVVWALKKFRGYIEGTEITVASDHQPLKWLLNLKSPTGRLARWALEIQSFNLKVQYIPGKANVVANMFQARRLLQQQFPTEPSIPQQELLLQQLIMSPRRDVVGSIGEIVTPVV